MKSPVLSDSAKPAGVVFVCRVRFPPTVTSKPERNHCRTIAGLGSQKTRSVEPYVIHSEFRNRNVCEIRAGANDELERHQQLVSIDPKTTDAPYFDVNVRGQFDAGCERAVADAAIKLKSGIRP